MALCAGSAFADTSILKAHFIDVGQGDCALIQTPGGKNILVDGGPEDDYADAGRDIIVPYLAKLGIKKIDAIFISHAHRDHIGGIPAIIKNFEVGAVYDTGYAYPSPIYEKLLRQINANKITYVQARADTKVVIDPAVEIKILGPPKRLPWDDPNNNSMVVRLLYKEISFLFTGDIEADAEDSLVRIYRYGLESNILKVPHHGSKTSCADYFLEAVNPEVAVIPVGRRNRFRHPGPSTVKKLKDFGINVYRNDLDGTVVVDTDGFVFEVKKLGFQ
jgi:competence protein ComEC